MLESAPTPHFSKYPEDDATDQHDIAINPIATVLRNRLVSKTQKFPKINQINNALVERWPPVLMKLPANRSTVACKLEMTTFIYTGGFNPILFWAGKCFRLERFQRNWQCAAMLYGGIRKIPERPRKR